ncbi:Patatin-like phospholipase domain [Dillenia turbinata]|uniref:Patatin n=1 Tax=Dillenia turbinata TaxID=194707 RepID=A0AAN8UV36_9MAGN
MSWGLGWKRQSEVFHLTLNYGTDEQIENDEENADPEFGFRISLDWNSGDDEDQVALRLQSQLMVALPSPQDSVVLELKSDEEDGNVGVDMKVVKRREPLRVVKMEKAIGHGQQSDGIGVLTRLISSNLALASGNADGSVSSIPEHWRSVTVVSLCGCGLMALPVELTRLPLLEKLYLDNNKLSVLPPELGDLKNLKVLRVDNNMLVSVPVELRQCVGLVELSLEHNKLIRPLLDFRAMSEIQVLRLFGNPLVFLPEILPLHKLRHLSLANIRVISDENLKSVTVQIEMESSYYFGASKHKLSAFFSLIFRFSSCHHPLLASALAKIMQDHANRVVVGKDENAVRQLISMISSDNHHVVEQACFALSALAADITVAMQLMKCDIMQPIEIVLRSAGPDELISVLQVVANLAFASDSVQRLALLSVGNLAFCLENRLTLVTSESLRELLLRLTIASNPHVNKAAARAFAILGENENLRRALKGRPVAKRGLRILSMDGGGMKGLTTVQILKEIEKGTGKQIHEMFDLICGTSTGGMLAVALGVKLMTLDQCEEIYKKLGKLVFAEPVAKDNEAASWKDKLDQLYKSSSQSFRVVVHGSKHSAEQFERLLKEMCADEDGDLLIESAVKSIPKVFVVSSLVSVAPAQPFLFRNYQYPAGTPEIPFGNSESFAISGPGAATLGAQVGYKRSASIGSCKHHIWQAIRASSAAPYYLDDFSDEMNRWQDGAIVANNPTVLAVREAQFLWPDTRIDCLVSIGCGSTPTKVRKGGWRYLDTGQVLIESACSVDRVEEALSTLLPMIPEINYYRFNPVDERCDMELDETDPAIWVKLEIAAEEYIQNNAEAFQSVCERLTLQYQHDEKWSINMKSQQFPKAKTSSDVQDDDSPSLGWRRNVLLVEASHSPDSGRIAHHARSLETFCSRNGIRLSLMSGPSGTFKTLAATPFPTSVSPLFTGSFPSTPLLYSPDVNQARVGWIDLVPPLSLDGGKLSISTGDSLAGPRQLSVPVKSLHDKLQNSPQVGIVHLALQNDSSGSILSWQNDVFVVAEPGELADKFVQTVKLSYLSMSQGHHRKDASLLANISTIADLVARWPYFQVGGVVHRYIGRQTQVMEDDQEIGAYMFRRTVPSMHLTQDDVRWMVGAWRDRIILCTGTYGPTSALVKAFLDCGAKAVISPSTEPPESQLTTFSGSSEFCIFENGKFEIGEEDADDDEADKEEPNSPVSDWEDSDPEGTRDHSMGFWDGNEEELSRFVCQLYDYLFREGATVKVALQHALALHRKLSFAFKLKRVLP